MNETCPLCSECIENGQDKVQLQIKGCEGIRKASQQRGDSLSVEPGQFVHKACRLSYTNAKNIAIRKRKLDNDTNATSSKRSLRSDSIFNFKEDCLFCGKPTTVSNKTMKNVYPVRTNDFQQNIIDICNERKDSWANTVYGRIQSVQDLHAADAVYHQRCSVNFRTSRSIPMQFAADEVPSTSRVGRPSADITDAAFLKVATYLEENDDEQISVQDLVSKMTTYMEDKDCEPYSTKHMKRKLENHFGDKIIFTEINGKSNVVTFRSTAYAILHQFYSLPKLEDTEFEKLRVIKTAANLIKNDIKLIDSKRCDYPNCEMLSSSPQNMSYLPKSLQCVLAVLFAGKQNDCKIASIGQAIMQSVRPRCIVAPLQIGLAVQMHRQFGLRFLVDSLHSHGFCSSYTEVQMYERSAAVHYGTDINGYTPDMFIQHVADNVDHNIRTLDGLGTFHGMGIITTATLGILSMKPVPRVIVTPDDVRAVGKINMAYFKPMENAPSDKKFKPLPVLELEEKSLNVDILWNIAWFLKPERSSWNGFMQAVQKGPYPGKSSVLFMPMIDMKSTDEHCIYTTLRFVTEQAKKYNSTPILTFDQPLWWKASAILEKESPTSSMRSMILRLGGLHIEMSFLGSIGTLMGGSVLKEVLETIYADSAVGHMLSGKAISRAVRGHILIEAVLNAIILSNAYRIPLSRTAITEQSEVMEGIPDLEYRQDPLLETDDSNLVLPEDLRYARKMLDAIVDEGYTLQELSAEDSALLSKIECRVGEYKTTMMKFRTPKLWFQYLEMISILRDFIKAERTGDWQKHLFSLSKMLPYFTSSGHYLYAKSAYFYLQNMYDLQDTHPEVQKKFDEGYHVVRRSDRYWAGLSTDLVIEQMLMRSLKTCGGLTRGRGMTELQRSVWLLSTPSCSSVCQAMQEFTGTIYTSSEQHKDVSKARNKKDNEDMEKLLVFLQTRDPFEKAGQLMNIVSGVTADEKVNVDNAMEVGMKVVNAMAEQSVFEIAFKKKDQAVTLDSKVSVRIDDDQIKVDPQLLFQRIISATRDIDTKEEMMTVLSYELCSHPASLFDDNGLMRLPNKPQLKDAIANSTGVQNSTVPENSYFVIDGGALLQKLPWNRGSTFQEICELYSCYILRNYGQNVTVVFDGYSNTPSTKDPAHLRRNSGHVCTDIKFDETMRLNIKKDIFLSNTNNKSKFLTLLISHLEAKVIRTKQSDGDADYLIAKTATECAEYSTVTVVGDDTDLLILLLYHTTDAHNAIYLKQKPPKISKKTSLWHIQETQNKLGPDICTHILFIHAVLGCDTTSRVFSLGKSLSLSKFKQDKQFRECADVFNKIDATQKDVCAAGERALVALFNGKHGERINSLRFSKFFQKVADSMKCVKPETLPPTEDAAMFHSYRVYHQTQVWKGNNNLLPQDWGWAISKGQMIAIQTEKQPAPDKLLKVIRCKCKTDCKSARCTCKKHGLDCSPMCSDCKGVSCLNSTPTAVEDDESD